MGLSSDRTPVTEPRPAEGERVEPQPGMFVLHRLTARFESDPDVPGSQMSELVHVGPIWAGFTRLVDAPGPMTWMQENREVLAVMEEVVRRLFSVGRAVSLGRRDSAPVAPGV